MPKVKDLIEKIENFAPLATQEKWDNSGWQINLGRENFSKIMTTLTVTEDVINQANERHCDFILAHHPLIFSPLKVIESKEIIKAIEYGIQIYSAHTNLDLAKGGTTYTLAEKCGFSNCDFSDGFIIGKKLDIALKVDELKEKIKKNLKTDSLREINLTGKKSIKSVAFCAGAGGSEIAKVNKSGFDLFITGEVKFHEALEANDTRVIEVGHFDSEKFTGEIFRKILGNSCNIEEANEKRPFQIC